MNPLIAARLNAIVIAMCALGISIETQNQTVKAEDKILENIAKS